MSGDQREDLHALGKMGGVPVGDDHVFEVGSAQFRPSVVTPIVPSCRDCKWWGLYHDEYSGMAQCRRFPPIANAGHSRGGVVAVFPKTAGHEFCGEFAAKS